MRCLSRPLTATLDQAPTLRLSAYKEAAAVKPFHRFLRRRSSRTT
jgi:hypothetical protein